MPASVITIPVGNPSMWHRNMTVLVVGYASGRILSVNHHERTIRVLLDGRLETSIPKGTLILPRGKPPCPPQ